MYAKQYDNFFSNYYSSYLVDKSPNTPIHSNIQYEKDKNLIHIQPTTPLSDIVHFCINNDIFIPGLCYHECKTLIDLLDTQEHHYFDMIHNNIVCIFTIDNIYHNTDTEFKILCANPQQYSINKKTTK